MKYPIGIRDLKIAIQLLVVCCLFSCASNDSGTSNFGDKSLNILWIGTSIPEGCSYPAYSCKSINANCINKSLGASFLGVCSVEEKGIEYVGLSLTETVAEKEDKYRKYVVGGKLSNSRLNDFKAASYESRVLPYVASADVVVIDHGFNDRLNLYELYKDRNKISEEDTIWNSYDRSNYIGAFNYLLREIRRVNKDVVVLVGGYFQNKCTIDYTVSGRYIQQVSEDIARHWKLPILDVWNYVDIADGYKPHSENYINNINAKYNKSFVKWLPNEKGEITNFQVFCPDRVHPFSDPTGKSDSILNEKVTIVLSRRMSEVNLLK